jgi:hypothetical protein
MMNNSDWGKEDTRRFNGLQVIFQMNFEEAYGERRKKRLAQREAASDATEQLQKVCESHKTRKE